ncbi:hypothetical protein [Pseudochryseolinea flava]|uniref:Uncharacterized protein n=1 Tax=Pseudochryseolinea flava TaxID=2059302 RepID=A0A364XW19_9BACT|nr:hypothetical protein [Pseudochryseolinea flava]RAV98384.1 hypothetical protein DQQ10_23950 [Pseudochryseolinea flava]
MKKDLRTIAHTASLDLKIVNETMKVSAKFSLRNRFNIGMLLIFVVSITVLYFLIDRVNNIDWAFVVMMLLVTVLLMLSLLSLIKQCTDFLLITGKEIVFRNSLRTRVIKVEPALKVNTSIQRIFTRTQYASRGSYSWQVEITIEKREAKIRILDFSVDHDYFDGADYLRKTIERFLTQKIEATHAGNLPHKN